VYPPECGIQHRLIAEAASVPDLEAARDHPGHPGPRRRHWACLDRRAGLLRPGYRSRLICRLHSYHGHKGETRAFT
jgi:hypothetical protein